MTDTPPLVGYGGADDTLMYVDIPGKILMDSGVLKSHGPVGFGFDMADFESVLQFCPINPHELKPSSTFKSKNYDSLTLQDSHAFPGRDADKPDDTYFFSRAVAVTGLRPSLFTGKMRLFMQCLYGSHNKKGMNKSLVIELQGQDNNKSSLGSLKLGTFSLTTNTILYTDTVNYRYFLIRIGANSVEIGEIIFDKLGSRIIKQLRGDPKFTSVDSKVVESFLLSRAEKVSNIVTVTGFSTDNIGSPLYHSWHANWNGHTAAMVTVSQTATYYTSRLCELDFTLNSVIDPQDNKKWIDTWVVALRVSQESGHFAPRRGFDNIFIGTEAMFHPVTFIPVTGAAIYCYYNQADELDIIRYTGYKTPYERINSGWSPTPFLGSIYDTNVVYCGLVNASRTVEVRSGYKETGFSGLGGSASMSQGWIDRSGAIVTSSPAGDQGIASSDNEGGCDVPYLGEIHGAPGVRTHPCKHYVMSMVRQDTSQTEWRDGYIFLYIPLYDAEACFMGSQQISTKNTPNITSTPGTGIYQEDHYHWRSTWPGAPDYGTPMEHVGDFVGTCKRANGTGFSYSDKQTYTQGVPDNTDAKSAICCLRYSRRAIKRLKGIG